MTRFLGAGAAGLMALAGLPGPVGAGPGWCAPLPPPSGSVIRVGPSQADALPAIVAGAASGTTILLEDGTYRSTLSSEGSRRINFQTPGVTLRSASDNAAAVVIDGEYVTDEIINISASNVTIAHVTLTRANDHPVHVSPANSDVTGTRLYGLRIIDGGEQFVKGNPNGARTAWVDSGRIECSYFELTDAGRPHVERNPGGCYTGGIDIHSARGWVVRLNTFVDIYCAGQGLAEHAVHFWIGSRGTVVENNVIVNCARGIGFGLGATSAGRVYADVGLVVGHHGGIIRNNVIYANIPYYDSGIGLEQARQARVFHNTVYATPDATDAFSSIDYRFPETNAQIRNNLVNNITRRDGGRATRSNNKVGVTASYFVDAGALDFHLVSTATEAIDRGIRVSGAGVDIDGQSHNVGPPDIGADEFTP